MQLIKNDYRMQNLFTDNGSEAQCAIHFTLQVLQAGWLLWLQPLLLSLRFSPQQLLLRLRFLVLQLLLSIAQPVAAAAQDFFSCTASSAAQCYVSSSRCCPLFSLQPLLPSKEAATGQASTGVVYTGSCNQLQTLHAFRKAVQSDEHLQGSKMVLR
jgi:hypothetical protein